MRSLRLVTAALLCACANPTPPPSVVRPRTEIEATPLAPEDKSNLIRVRTPKPGALAKSPLHVTGVARGTWYFEGSFPVALYDERRRELARSYATAQGEWMTDDFVPFEADLVFAAGGAREGTLVLERRTPRVRSKTWISCRSPCAFRASAEETAAKLLGHDAQPKLAPKSSVIERQVPMRRVFGVFFVVLIACGSSDSGGSDGDGEGGGNTSAAASGTPTCKMTITGDAAASEPYSVEGEGAPTGLLMTTTTAAWAVVNGPKANGIIGCNLSDTSDAGVMTRLLWVVEMDQPGPLEPYSLASDTAKLNSAGHSPVNISFTTLDGASYACAVTGAPQAIGTFDFDVSYAKPSPSQPGNAMGWLVKATGHAECPGSDASGNSGMVSIDVVFDVK